MTLLLNHVVQAVCPGCKATLKIPANWISEPMKCKHCGLVFQAKAPSASSSSGREKHVKPAPLLSKPFAPPPGVIVGIPTGAPGQPGVPMAKAGYAPAGRGGVPVA